MTYKESQYKHQVEVLSNHPSLFNGDRGDGLFRKKTYPFVLQNGLNNLYGPIRGNVIQYFRENRIAWWGGHKPTGHMLSSQIACLNHLFAIREDKDAVLNLVNHLRNGLHFEQVLPLSNDKDPQYITFEAVSQEDHLNEGEPSRGTNCTSIDALIAAKTVSGETWLIPIEWKYSEVYYKQDKSKEKGRGAIRLERYSSLIDSSTYLKKLPKYEGSPYFFEPFYQLMRQTLWAEHMILHKDEEWIKTDRLLHVHVVPSENVDLLQKKYHFSGKGMVDSWKELLIKDTYQLTTPEEFLSPLEGNTKYSSLLDYLRIRYWQDSYKDSVSQK